jgi:hypothetical protein
VTGVVGSDEDDRVATEPGGDSAPFSGSDSVQEPSVDSGASERTASNQDFGLDTALESDAALGSLNIATAQAATQSLGNQTSQLSQQQTPAEQTPTSEQVFNQPRINDPNSPTEVPRIPSLDPDDGAEDDLLGFSASSDLFASGIVDDPFGADLDGDLESGAESTTGRDSSDFFEVDADSFGSADGLGDVDIDTSGGLFDTDS